MKHVLLSILYVLQKILLFRGPRLTVLMYHSISDANDLYAVAPQEFDRQMRYVRKHHNIIAVSDIRAYLEGSKLMRDTIAITFDDGYKDFITAALPILEKYQIPATVFVIGGEVDRTELGNTMQLLGKSDVPQLHSSLVSIGSHTLTHPKLTRMSEAQIKHELVGSRARIGDMFGINVDMLAYPKGSHTERIKELARKAGYRIAFSAVARAVHRSDDPYAIPRVQVDSSTSFRVFIAKLTPAQDWYYTAWKLFH